MIKNYLAILIALSASTINSAESNRLKPHKTTTFYKSQNNKNRQDPWVQLALARGRLLRNYNPTQDRCRPQLRLINGLPVKVPNQESLPSMQKPDGTLACMVKGYKKIAFEMPVYSFFSKDLKIILSSYEIRYFRYKIDGTTSEIWYLPDSKKEALLLLKAALNNEDFSGLFYVYGKLIGYSEEDIYALYLSNGQKDGFFSDKKEFEVWLQAHKDTIENWFEANKERYHIKTGILGRP